jgi:SAM-dependent MidA family methyltransferase
LPAEPDAALLDQIARQIPDAGTLQDGYLTEVHPVACGFMRSLAQMFEKGKGAAILFDYGFPAHEYYFDERTQRHPDVPLPPPCAPGPVLFAWPAGHHGPRRFHGDGAGRAGAGLDVLGYMSQASFLLAAGIGELLLKTDPEDALRYLPQSKAVQKLVSPAEMGELFKVLMVGSGVALDPAIVRADR